MAEPTGKLKDDFVPLEQRGSQHIDWKPFVIDTVKFFVVAKLSALAGYFVGRKMEARNLRIGRLKMDGQWGGLIGGTIGGIYELYDHWHKTESQRLGVRNISTDLQTVIDPTQLERETQKQEALLADMAKLEAALGKPRPSHAERTAARREEAAQRQPAP